jgi:hypothetical protein
MRWHLSLLLGTCALYSACSRSTNLPREKVSNPAAVATQKAYDEKVPPTSKEVVKVLLVNHDVPLSVDSSCSGVGTDPSDATIGEYLSGFLAEQSSQDGKNWLDVSVNPELAQGTTPQWKCSVVIRHVQGEDRWGWGVSFLMGAKDHKALAKSFRCTGAG